MAVRFQHPQEDNSIYFVTFTCYNWMQLLEITNSYELIYKWFDELSKKDIRVTGYVTMPNHFHGLLYFPTMPKSLNTVIGNAKRFIAYEVIKKLKQNNKTDILQILTNAVKPREKRKGQLRKVFEDSFDAKWCYSPSFIYRKLDYIHHNPVSGPWQLANSFTEYPHSSAAFYEGMKSVYDKLIHVSELL